MAHEQPINDVGVIADADQMEASFTDVARRASHPDLQSDPYIRDRCAVAARGYVDRDERWSIAPVLFAGDMYDDEFRQAWNSDDSHMAHQVSSLPPTDEPLMQGGWPCCRCEPLRDDAPLAKHVLWVAAGRTMVEIVVCDDCRVDLDRRFHGIRWIVRQS